MDRNILISIGGTLVIDVLHPGPECNTISIEPAVGVEDRAYITLGEQWYQGRTISLPE